MADRPKVMNPTRTTGSSDLFPSPCYKELRPPVDFLLSFCPSLVSPFRSLDLDPLYRYRSPTSALALLFELCTNDQLAVPPSLTFYAGFYGANESMVGIQRSIMDGWAHVVRIHCLLYAGYPQLMQSRLQSKLRYILATYHIKWGDTMLHRTISHS